eukprot:tig00000215_g18527.t1
MPLESNSFGEKVFPVAEALDEAGWMASCINCGFGAATLLVLPCPSERLDDMEPSPARTTTMARTRRPAGNNNAKESSAALEADKASRSQGQGQGEDTPATGRGLRTQEQRKQPDRLKMDEQLPRGKTSKSKKRSGPGDEATGDESGGSPPPKRGRAPGKEHPRSADSGDEEGAGVASADLGPPELGDDSVLDGTDKSEERRRALLDDARLHKVLKSAYTQPAPGSGARGLEREEEDEEESGDGSQGAEAGQRAAAGARGAAEALEASFAKAEDQRVQACFLVSAGILHLCESRARAWPNVEKEVEDKFGAVMRAGHFPVNQRTFKVFLNVGALVREFRGYANVATDDELRALHEKLGADVPENLFPCRADPPTSFSTPCRVSPIPSIALAPPRRGAPPHSSRSER